MNRITIYGLLLFTSIQQNLLRLKMENYRVICLDYYYIASSDTEEGRRNALKFRRMYLTYEQEH